MTVDPNVDKMFKEGKEEWEEYQRQLAADPSYTCLFWTLYGGTITCLVLLAAFFALV